jgi:prophage antirepressor-like protein
MSLAILKFEENQFDVVDRSGQPWLRGMQVASALGYKNPSADIRNLFDRNADEFTEQMTTLVKLSTAGGEQEVRIFSLRGCHLLAMLARTDKAKAFRRWVLDILDGLQREPDLSADLIGLIRDVVNTQNKTLELINSLTSKRRGSNSRPPLAADIAVILKLKSEDIHQAQIARELGLSTAAVSLILSNQYRVNPDGSVNVGVIFKHESN